MVNIDRVVKHPGFRQRKVLVLPKESSESSAKRVLSVGQCSFDHSAISRMIRKNFAAEVIPAEDAKEALDVLQRSSFALVFINRILDGDGSDGMDLLRAIKQSPLGKSLPVMLITNYPQYQKEAQAAGGEPGFGKSELNSKETIQKLGRYLNASSAPSITPRF